jgi:hypothetical protein
MKHFKVLAVPVLVLSFLISACSGGGGSGSGNSTATVQLSGTVDKSSGNYQVAAKRSSLFFAKALWILGFGSPAYAVVADPTVNKVLAIPMYSGSLQGQMMAYSKSATIDSSTGTFSLSLEKDRDWLLVLIDSSVTGTARFVGSLALDAGSSNSLLNFPATDSSLSTMPLGTVSRASSNGDALTSTVVGTTDFSLSASQLVTLSKTDKLFRNAMNIVNNYGTFGNSATVWYQLRPDFHWDGSLSSLVTTTALNSAPSLTYSGMNFQLDTNSTSVAMSTICTTTGHVALHPPLSAGVITMGTKTFDYANPIKNSASCQDWNGGPAKETVNSDLYACNGYLPDMTYSVQAYFTDGTMPAGFWEWKENGIVKAAFDIGSINPPITPTGQLKGYIPTYKINVGVNNKITSVDIAWFYYDGVTYTQLLSADLNVLKHFIGQIEAKFEATVGTRRTCEMYIDPTVETSFNPADARFASTCQADPLHKDWYYNNSGFPETNTGLMGFYETGGFGYFFDYRL